MEKVCKFCSMPFKTGDKRKVFCSRDCHSDNLSATRKGSPGTKHNEETRKKIAASLREFHAGRAPRPDSRYNKSGNRLSKDERTIRALESGRRRGDARLAAVAALPFDELSPKQRFDRVKQQQAFACGRCLNYQWLDQPITLEIDHIDGDNRNNDRDNLIALCPNCHSYTPTWRGRNASKKVTDEEMIAAMKAHSSITQALTALGMAAKGGNFKRAKRLAGIPEGTKMVRKRGNLDDFT